jgi:hypothetical protein
VVQTVKLTSLNPSGDCPPPHPKIEQLDTADDTMLPPRQLGDLLVRVSSRQFCPSWGLY